MRRPPEERTIYTHYPGAKSTRTREPHSSSRGLGATRLHRVGHGTKSAGNLRVAHPAENLTPLLLHREHARIPQDTQMA